MVLITLVDALKGHTERPWHVSWSPDGKVLASCGSDKTVRIWQKNRDNWECVSILEETQDRTIRRCEWSPCGRYLATVSFDATTYIWYRQNMESNEYNVVSSLEGHENEVKSVAWNSSGSLLATCGRDKTIWIWDSDEDNEFECVSVLHGHTQDVKTIKWHPHLEMLISVSYDNTIKIWKEDIDDWYCAQTLTGHTSTVWDLSFNSDGSQFVTVSDDKSMIFWKYYDEGIPSLKGMSEESGSEPAWGRIGCVDGHHERTIFSVDWSKFEEQSLIVTGGADDALRLFREDAEGSERDDVPCFVLAYEIPSGHEGDVNCVHWNPVHPNLLATVGDDNLLKIWKLEDII